MSLIGMHSAVRDGFAIPPAAVKWKYLKGSEKDFEGAPEWATIRERMNDSREYFVERYECGKRYTNAIHKGDEFTFLVNDFGTGDIIAQRETLTSADVEVVKYDPTKVDIESLIAERGTRYGKFKDGAEIMRDLKHVMHDVDGWNNLSPSQKEALDMIQHKIGRILNGDPNYDDNWKDIAGYAKLIADELNGEIK